MSRSTVVPHSPVSVHPSAGSKLALRGGTPVSATPIPFMSTALSEADIAAATAVLRSGMLRQASKCAELEDRLGKLSHAGHAMTCANGTCALQLAYEALIQPGDEVLVPAWSYIATVAMVIARGAVPIFCDALPGTMQIDPADARRRVTPRTTAIAATHLYGCPVDIDAIQALASRHNLRVVYDAAQAHLASYRGRGIGAYGDAVTYSFYATKNLATGEGGMVTCNSGDVARAVRLLRSHGETDKYLHERIGYNYRMNDITAAIGCSRLDRLADQTEARRRVAQRYDRIVGAIGGLDAPETTVGAEPVYHLYTVRLDPDRFTCTRDEFCAALKAEGVPTAVHYPRPLTRQPALARFATEPMPVAESLCDRVLCLPMHHDLSDAHVQAVGEALNKVAEAYRA
jgi:perosamine synthetase